MHSKEAINLIKSRFFTLPISVPPDILDYPTSTDMVVREGSNVTLKCAATGSPSPNITWRREGGEKIMLLGGSEGESKLKAQKYFYSIFRIIQNEMELKLECGGKVGGSRGNIHLC